jgi:hypothetical protein
MEITQWYAISLGALAALYISYYILHAALSVAHVFGAHFVVKHLIHPQIPQILRGEDTITRFHSLLIFLYLSGNGICLAFGITSTAQLGIRSGLMSLVNLIPLCAGGRINMVADFCGLSQQNYSRMHRWIGRVAVVQGLTHAVISFREAKSKPELSGLLVIPTASSSSQRSQLIFFTGSWRDVVPHPFLATIYPSPDL